MVQDINLTRGRSYDLNLEVTDLNGNGYTLGDGEVLLFGIKKDTATEEAPIICRAAEETGTAGFYTFHLYPEDTQDLTPGRYYYDVGLESGGNYYNIIETSVCMLMHNVTKKGDAYD